MFFLKLSLCGENEYFNNFFSNLFFILIKSAIFAAS